jgi:hypothetical protein
MEHITRPREGGLSRLSHDDLLAQLATSGVPAEGSRPRLSARWYVDSNGQLFCSWQVEERTEAWMELRASQVVVRSIIPRVAGRRFPPRRTLMALAASLAIAVCGAAVSEFVGTPHDPALAAARLARYTK